MSKIGHSHVNELFQKVLQCDKGDDFGVVQVDFSFFFFFFLLFLSS